jgi:hypothetical protein
MANAFEDRPEPSQSPGHPELESGLVSKVLRSPIPIALLLLLLTALGSACQAVVMEPVDETSSYKSNIQFWGYSGSPGETVAIEAQNSSGTWEALVTTTSQIVPTHTAGYTGYYFSTWYYGPNIPTRFRRTSPFASQGYWRTNFRIMTSGTAGAARLYQANGSNSTSTNWFEEYWYEHKAASSVIRVDVHP